jgi:hypothetical protein
MYQQLTELIQDKEKILEELKQKGKIEGDYAHSSAAMREKDIRVNQLETEVTEGQL